MAIKNSHPMRFTPKGLVDAFDATEEFPGACQSLANLVFDQSNPELVVARPGVVSISQLANLGFQNPTAIAIQAVVGNLVFGMVATSRFAGKDEPFCLDLSSGSNVPVSGVTNANTPFTQITSGDWTPPTFASVGVYILATHPGFAGVAGKFFGWFDLTTPGAPAWNSGDLATNPLGSVAVAVANFRNRAYFAFKVNQLAYSDVLAALTRTNASQQLTIGDTGAITALSGLPMQTTSSGVLAALMVFKPTQVWQVTGDTVTNDLDENYVSLTIGTSAPRTVVQCASGLYFLSTGGPYFIDPFGMPRPLSHDVQRPDPDIDIAFINALTPTRWAGAYNSSIYRVCGPTVIRGITVTVDYWFDEKKRRWTGPHSFVYDCASAYQGYFVLSSVNRPGLLVKSQTSKNLSSTYTDLGTNYNVNLLSSTFPKVGDMAVKQVSGDGSQIELGGAPFGATYTIQAQDESGNVLDTVTIIVRGSIGLWGDGRKWGDGSLWQSGQTRAPQTYAVPWHVPLVFEKMQLSITAQANANVAIGTFFARYQKTGYMTQNQGAAA